MGRVGTEVVGLWAGCKVVLVSRRRDGGSWGCPALARVGNLAVGRVHQPEEAR